MVHHKAHERGLGIEGLLTWFRERISAGDAGEEYQIRLETDEKAVKIVTVHVSKGLEYPVVFCPFMWGGISDSDQHATFHDGFTMVKDFGSPDYELHRVKAQQETLAESLRLLYVALTRAKYRCYLIAGKVTDSTKKNRPETSPLAYLFHASAETRKSEEVVARLGPEVAGLAPETMVAQLQALQAPGEGSIAVVPMPAPGADDCTFAVPDDGRPLACRTFSGIINSDWRVSSFTSFAAHESASPELPDRDAASTGNGTPRTTADEVPTAKSIFTFPKGAQAGIFLHAIFEELDFAASPEEVDVLVEKGLEKHGYEKGWLPHIAAMVNNVVTTPLAAPDGSFTLSDLRKGNWIQELEFFFPLKFITSELLRGYLSKWGSEYRAADLGRICGALRFKPVQGMVRGFMDMVFEQRGRYYLVDWKSNHLGFRVEDYHRQSLRTAMEQHLYPLQYLLYTVALNRYLSGRIRDYDYSRHFGGVLYIFVRGVSPQYGEDYGIFRDVPPIELIDELTRVLVGTGG